MKNILIVFLSLLVLAGIGGTIYYFKQTDAAKKEYNKVVQQNTQLSNELGSAPKPVEVLTVNKPVQAGMIIAVSDLAKQYAYASSVNSQTITQLEDLVGKYYKVDLQPGTTLTKDLVMEEVYDEILYERDLFFDYLPVGLKVGDYIDIRLTLPYGEEFIVIQHERVQDMIDASKLVKVILNEAQLALYTSARKDYALYKQKGLSVYITKYVEPGITDEAIPFYPVRKEMEASVEINPNIVDKQQCINTQLREQIDEMLAKVTIEDGGMLMGDVSTEAAAITVGHEEKAEEPNGSNDVGTSGGNDNPNGLFGGQTFGEAFDDAYQQLINLDTSGLTGDGNNITQGQIQGAEGDNIYGEDDDIR